MQQSLFEIIYPIYKVTKPIRLIEAFGGYGSQHFALKYLGVKVEHWKLIEWAVKSIQAYKDGHYTNVEYKCDETVTKEVLIDYLHRMGISFDYNKPATREEIKRRSFEELKQIALNIKITKNLVNICNVKGKDLDIVDKDKYEYIFTYSFPCQDLSLAGKGKGMKRDSGTRSGMLWEVERILEECNQINSLPQILLMENVPQVIGTDNVNDFNEWQLKLESLGYKNYHQNLIATDYEIPQTRNRTFMISILGDYSYTFPNPIPLKLKLKDMLEDNVDEKYYLSSKQLEQISNWNAYQNPFDTIDKENCPTLTTRSGAFAAGMVLTKDTENYIEWEEKGKLDIDCRAFKDEKVVSTIMTTPKNKVLENSSLMVKEATKKGYAIAHDGDGVYIQNIKGKRGMVQKGKMQTLKTSPDTGVVVNYGIATNESKEWQKQPLEELSRTLLSNKSNSGVGVIIKGNYSPSGHNASRIVDENGLAPTVMENHGTVTATQTNDLRIRKLSTREVFRLMGVKDEDYERIAKNQSDSSLYHLAGDSIITTVLMAIFSQLLDIDWREHLWNDIKE